MAATAQLDPLIASLPEATRFDPREHPERFEVIHNVAVFAEHETTTNEQRDAAGNVIKAARRLKFGPAELAAVARRCNQRIAETGDFATVTIGHTPDPALRQAGLAKDPPQVGFAGPFRLGRIKNKAAILADLHIFRDDVPTVRKLGRRSAELWLEERYEDMFLDPISLLGAEAPRLDMGVLYSASLHTAGKARHVERYTAVAPAAGNVFMPSEKYGTDQQQPQGGQPMALGPEDIQQIVDALMQTDVMQWAQGKMQEEAAPEPSIPQDPLNGPPGPGGLDDGSGMVPPPMGGDPMGAAPPAGPPGAPPAPPAPPAAPPMAGPPADGGAGGPPVDDGVNPPSSDKQKYSRQHALANQIAAMQRQIEDLRAQLASETEKRVDAERYSRLASMAGEGILVDPSKEMERLKYSRCTHEQFENNVGWLLEHAQRVPLNVMPPSSEPQKAPPLRQSAAGPEQYSKAHSDRATRIVLERRSAGQEVDYGAVLADVKAGKL